MPQPLNSPLNRAGVIADITGPVLTDADRDFIAQPELSGLIFFVFRHGAC